MVRCGSTDLGNPGEPVDPDRYGLTLEDGTKFTLDQGFGIRQARGGAPARIMVCRSYSCSSSTPNKSR